MSVAENSIIHQKGVRLFYRFCILTSLSLHFSPFSFFLLINLFFSEQLVVWNSVSFSELWRAVGRLRNCEIDSKTSL
jgi:hypothetical protein